MFLVDASARGMPQSPPQSSRLLAWVDVSIGEEVRSGLRCRPPRLNRCRRVVQYASGRRSHPELTAGRRQGETLGGGGRRRLASLALPGVVGRRRNSPAAPGGAGPESSSARVRRGGGPQTFRSWSLRPTSRAAWCRRVPSVWRTLRER